MLDFHGVNVAVHVAAGALALIAGAGALLTRKGAAAHRKAGRVFAWLGGIILATAVVADVLYDPPGPLVAATLAFGYQYLSSLRTLALKARAPSWLDAALAMAGLAACAALLVFMGQGTASWTPAIGYSTVGYTAAVALYDLSRPLWAGVWVRHARPLDHGLKMTGAYFAMMSAGVGNVLRDLQPWSQIGPSILGVVVMLVLAGAYLSRGRRESKSEAPLGSFKV
jgi:hypothetical protein